MHAVFLGSSEISVEFFNCCYMYALLWKQSEFFDFKIQNIETLNFQKLKVWRLYNKF